MKYFSMFSGIGGFELGIKQAYERYNLLGEQTKERSDNEKSLPMLNNSNGARRGSRPTCVGYSEIDKYAVQVYKKHFPKHKNYGDATKIDPRQLPDFQILVGGFPCQAFSIAGKRLGFNETRGTLFFDIARIASDKRPEYLVLENVKGLLSHDNGKTFQTIIGVLADLGYSVEWQVLNSKDFGVPQNRERVFIIGHLGGFGGRKVFPITRSNSKALREVTKGVSDAQRIYESNGLAKTLKGLGGGQGAKTGLYAVPVLTPDRAKKRQNGRRMKTNGEPSFTLTAQDRHGVYDGVRIRRLTPTECARLQGFPDNWHEGLSDTQAYKCYGNAVTVNVIKAIFEKLCR